MTRVEATDWSQLVAARARGRTGGELSTILAGSPPGVLSLSGGFPHPSTFPGEILGEIVSRLVRDDGAVALQYTPCEGLPGVREYLLDRQEQLEGRRPALGEMMVTSGGMDCIALACQSLVDPGDTVLVEAPTYLGALMAFAGVGAEIAGVPADEEGVVVDALEERLVAGLRPKLLYVIPDHQNPTGRSLPLARRRALVETCRRHGVLVLEDVAYRELSFEAAPPPSLWSLAPDVVLQAGTFSKVFFPGVRLGWAVGPASIVEQLAAAKQTADQCAAALGQRMLEEYGRAGHFERRLPAVRALYASHWHALDGALRRHLPPGCSWTAPAGGFFTWVRLPDGMDALELRPAATTAGVAYVPGAPFYPGDAGRDELRLSLSQLAEPELELGAERLGAAVRAVAAG